MLQPIMSTYALLHAYALYSHACVYGQQVMCYSLYMTHMLQHGQQVMCYSLYMTHITICYSRVCMYGHQVMCYSLYMTHMLQPCMYVRSAAGGGGSPIQVCTPV